MNRAGPTYNAASMSTAARHDTRPLIALTVGDVAGIGPEIVRAATRESSVRASARIVVVGPAHVRPRGVEPFDDGAHADVAWLATEGPARWTMGEPQAECGRAAVAALRAAAQLAADGRVTALVTAPVSKQAMHLAGVEVEGQTELLARWAGASRHEMLAIAGELRVMLLSRHLPLREALELVTRERVIERMALLDETLRALGVARPRLALAGFNPHAGESGIFGGEERERLAPAVRELRGRGIDVSGPHPPDTVFLAASRGEHDAVLALYHDQAFIPLKLLSAGRGLTLVAGLPYLRLSPVHGTAFDIAGRGVASAENLVHALRVAAEWGPGWSARAPVPRS